MQRAKQSMNIKDGGKMKVNAMCVKPYGCHSEYHAIAHRDADGQVIVPGCPKCAISLNARGPNVSTCMTRCTLEHTSWNGGRLIVHDPVSRKTLSGNAIKHIVMNGDKIQVCLHRGWLAGIYNLDSRSLRTQTDYGPNVAMRTNHAGDTPEQSNLVAQLRELWIQGLLAVYDPLSHWLMSDGMIAGICANGDAVQITLSKSWPYGGSYPARE